MNYLGIYLTVLLLFCNIVCLSSSDNGKLCFLWFNSFSLMSFFVARQKLRCSLTFESVIFVSSLLIYVFCCGALNVRGLIQQVNIEVRDYCLRQLSKFPAISWRSNIDIPQINSIIYAMLSVPCENKTDKGESMPPFRRTS